MNSFPILQTDRLLLREFRDSDLDAVFEGLSHPDVIKYYGVSYTTREETKAQMQYFSDVQKGGTGFWWAICKQSDNRFCGAGGLYNVHHTHKKGEIGFWLHPGFWKQGIMTEALPLICNYGFRDMGLHRIEGIVESDNIVCKTALEKLQFDYEGRLKECEIKNGAFISLDIYARFHPFG